MRKFMDIEDFLGKYSLYALLVLFYYDVVSAPVKYYMINAGIGRLSIIPLIACILTVFAYTFWKVFRLKIEKRVLYVTLFVFFVTLYTLTVGIPGLQMGYGLFVYFPAFVGILLQPKAMEFLQKHAIYMWAIATVGVFMNAQIDFPWKYMTYEVAGVERNLYLQWTAFDVERLAGFARNNFLAAFHILVFGTLCLTQKLPRVAKLAIWGASLVALYLTTAKTSLGVMLLIGTLLGAQSLGLFRRSALTFGIVMAICVLLPVISLTWNINGGLEDSTVYSFLTLETIGIRMEETWPDSFNLLLKHNYPISLILGQGWGAIGGPLSLNEWEEYNPGDNLFVFLYLNFGLMSLAILYWVFKGSLSALPEYTRDSRYYIGLVMIITGITGSVLESLQGGLLLGLLISTALEPEAAADDAATPLKKASRDTPTSAELSSPK